MKKLIVLKADVVFPHLQHPRQNFFREYRPAYIKKWAGPSSEILPSKGKISLNQIKELSYKHSKPTWRDKAYTNNHSRILITKELNVFLSRDTTLKLTCKEVEYSNAHLGGL